MKRLTSTPPTALTHGRPASNTRRPPLQHPNNLEQNRRSSHHFLASHSHRLSTSQPAQRQPVKRSDTSPVQFPQNIWATWSSTAVSDRRVHYPTTGCTRQRQSPCPHPCCIQESLFAICCTVVVIERILNLPLPTASTISHQTVHR